MKKKLAAIDVSSIEELQRIKVEQDVIRERLNLLEEKQGDVSEEVFDRVHLDYEGQVKSFEEQAEPLKVQARAQYVVLKALLVEIEAFVTTSEMDREELLLRNDLGEFSKETYATHHEECEGRITEHQENLSEAQALKERFLSAFHSEEELEEASQPDVIEEVQEIDRTLVGMIDAAALSEAPPQPPEEDEAVLVEVEESSPVLVEVEESSPVLNQDTQPLSVDTEDVPEQADSASEPPPVPEGATMILSWPKLLMLTENGDVQELTVVGASKTIVGSDEACDIVIVGERVAGRHAEIVVNEKGYMIRDLSSPVGTLVNDVEITEWNLSEGDTIQLGDVMLTFWE